MHVTSLACMYMTTWTPQASKDCPENPHESPASPASHVRDRTGHVQPVYDHPDPPGLEHVNLTVSNQLPIGRSRDHLSRGVTQELNKHVQILPGHPEHPEEHVHRLPLVPISLSLSLTPNIPSNYHHESLKPENHDGSRSLRLPTPLPPSLTELLLDPDDDHHLVQDSGAVRIKSEKKSIVNPISQRTNQLCAPLPPQPQCTLRSCTGVQTHTPPPCMPRSTEGGRTPNLHRKVT